jgi:hypothetical protein
MLTRLGETIGSWVPRSGGGDPITQIRAGWIGLVGANVAGAAQPVAIVDGNLVVITTSSAWSHQLAFLEPQIVRGIRALAPAAGIARLRFRVGTIRARGRRGEAAAAPVRRAAVVAGPAPSTAQEALARFRASVERARRIHAARGGVFCSACAAPIPRDGRCKPCRDWARAELEARCQRLLFDAPWLRPQDVLDTLPGLAAERYDVIRRRLLRNWWDEMALARKRAGLPRPIAPDRVRLRKIASSYVLLETKLDPNRLEMDSPVRRNALGELYDFIRSVEEDAHG